MTISTREETMKALIISVFAASLVAAPSFAQTTAPATTAPAVTSAKAGDQWRASKLSGLNVYNDKNEKLGDISEVIIDKTGKVAGVVIGVGGFLGMGQHDIMVSMDKLKFVEEPMRNANTGSSAPSTAPAANTRTTNDWAPDHAILAGATKDSLKAMTQFKYD
jgi:sporulation protein YlmC with PRC-barrel domain